MPEHMKTDVCITKGCKGSPEGEGVEVEEKTAYQRVSCSECNAVWELDFLLVDKVLITKGGS